MSKRENYAFAITVISLILAFPATMHGSTTTCAAGDVGCLVAAINDTNNNGQNNIINLSPGTYAVPTIVGNPACLPIITGTVTIHGVSAETTVITCTDFIRVSCGTKAHDGAVNLQALCHRSDLLEWIS